MENGSTNKTKAEAIFEAFLYTDQRLVEALKLFDDLKECLGLQDTPQNELFSCLKKSFTSWKTTSFFEILQRRINVKDYAGTVPICGGTNMFIVGAGPCGLRCAIEAALCGINVTIVEKRSEFTRNNVLHLWPYLIHDLRNLGIKKLYGKFCAGSLDHISIRRLQLILLKLCLVLGVSVHINTGYVEYLEPCATTGWRIVVKPANVGIESIDFHVLVGADGKRNSIPGFQRKEFRAKLAIGITANFVNKNTDEEAKIEEISGVAALFNQKFFADLKLETDIDLENIVYYKDDTHYFVMTAKKSCLLKKGVLKKDNSDVLKLLSYDNVDREQLLNFNRQAADFSAGLPHYEFAVDPGTGREDVAIFDFTSMYSAEYAARILEKRGHRLLVGLVGDGLMEPFWPLGTGCARGFLSCMDLIWTFKRLRSGIEPVEVLAERMALYQILHQTSNENMNKSHIAYTLDPKTRYKLIPKFSDDVTHLYEHVDKENKKSRRQSEVPALTETGPPKRKKLTGELTDTVHKEFKDKTFARTRRPKRPSIQPLIAPVKKRSVSPVAAAGQGKIAVEKRVSDQEVLLRWCKEKLKPILPFLPVTDLDTCWRDGVLLCGLVHLCSPADVNMGAVKNRNTDRDNVELAITVMSNELGVCSLAAEDILPPSGPDLLAIITTIVELKKILDETVPVKKVAPIKKAMFTEPNPKPVATTDKDVVPTNTTTEPPKPEPAGALKRRVHSQRKLRKKTESKFIEQVDTSAMPPPTHSTTSTSTPKKGSQKCHGCGQTVLVIKRITIEGYVFHRKCFKCEECETHLKTSTYHLITPTTGSTEPGRFYCKTHFNAIISRSRDLTKGAAGEAIELKKKKKSARPLSVFAKVTTAKKPTPNLPGKLPEDGRYNDTALEIHSEKKRDKSPVFRIREDGKKEATEKQVKVRTRKDSDQQLHLKKREHELTPSKPKRSKGEAKSWGDLKIKSTVQVTSGPDKSRAELRTSSPPSNKLQYNDAVPTEGMSKPILAVPAGNANVTTRKKSVKSHRAPEPPTPMDLMSTSETATSGLISNKTAAAAVTPSAKKKHLPIAAGVKGRMLPAHDPTPKELTPDTTSSHETTSSYTSSTTRDTTSRDTTTRDTTSRDTTSRDTTSRDTTSSTSRDSTGSSRDRSYSVASAKTEPGRAPPSDVSDSSSRTRSGATKPSNRVMAVRRYHTRASSVTDLETYLPLAKQKLSQKYQKEAEEDKPLSVKDRIAQYSRPGSSASSATPPPEKKRVAVGAALKNTVSRDKKIVTSSRSNLEVDGSMRRSTISRKRRPRLKPNHRRLVQAQTIQRDRSILEQKMTEFEQQAADIEQQLRTPENSHDDDLLSQFLEVVNIKNNLTRRENELHLCEKYLQLLDEQDQLEAELRYTMDLPETIKSLDEKVEEEELILRKFDVVNRRDYLLTQLHEDKKREEEEDVLIQEMLTSKGIHSNKYGYNSDCFITIEDLLEANGEDSGYNDEMEDEPEVNLRNKKPSVENAISKFFNRLSIFS